jgi:hypothetical protein
MFAPEQGLPTSSGEVSPSESMHQWEQYLQAQALWDHFLSFAPEAIQWTYNVQ